MYNTVSGALRSLEIQDNGWEGCDFQRYYDGLSRDCEQEWGLAQPKKQKEHRLDLNQKIGYNHRQVKELDSAHEQGTSKFELDRKEEESAITH